MKRIQRLSRFSLWSLLIAALIAGCSDGRPKRAAVSGRVTIDGVPLTHGVVRLIPEHARPATGELDSEGRYTLTCFEKGDGAVLGPCKVSITAIESVSNNVQKWHAPKKYASAEFSGLTADITGPTDSLDFELTWSGGKPFLEQISAGGGSERRFGDRPIRRGRALTTDHEKPSRTYGSRRALSEIGSAAEGCLLAAEGPTGNLSAGFPRGSGGDESGVFSQRFLVLSPHP